MFDGSPPKRRFRQHSSSIPTAVAMLSASPANGPRAQSGETSEAVSFQTQYGRPSEFTLRLIDPISLSPSNSENA
jgi:hypothetical protein